MDISFGDKGLAALCNSEELMVRRWGRDGFVQVGRRLLELAAANRDQIQSLPGGSVVDGPDGSVTISFDGGVLAIGGVMVGGSARPDVPVRQPSEFHVLRVQVRKGERSA